ncbi:MAG: MarR family winged helix-turn-helix transcriptional regulator [Chloroflexota bacterium]
MNFKDGDMLSVKMLRITKEGSVFLSKKLKKYNIGHGQHAYLLAIADNPKITQDFIANHFKTDKANVSRGVAKLVANGYVEYKLRRDDLRCKELTVTEKGTSIIGDILAAIAEWERKLVEKLTPEEAEQLNSLLSTVEKDSL